MKTRLYLLHQIIITLRRTSPVIITACLMIALSINSASAAVPMNSSVPMFHRTSDSAGFFNHSGDYQHLKWTFESGQNIISQPITDNNGNMYFIACCETGGQVLWSINKDTGTENWNYTTGGGSIGDGTMKLAIGANGVIYTCCNNKSEYIAVDSANGTLLRTFKANAPFDKYFMSNDMEGSYPGLNPVNGDIVMGGCKK